MTEWISVKERLPEDAENVLAIDCEYGISFGGDCAVANYNAKSWHASTELLDASNYDGGAEVELDKQACITHWMPLPEGPKHD